MDPRKVISFIQFRFTPDRKFYEPEDFPSSDDEYDDKLKFHKSNLPSDTLRGQMTKTRHNAFNIQPTIKTSITRRNTKDFQQDDPHIVYNS
jgi:hypothetical protein